MVMHMNELIKRIFEFILNKEVIPEDLMYEFSQDTMNFVRKKECEDLPEVFGDFQSYVELFWHSRKYNQIQNPKIIYQMGQLLAYVNMISDSVQDEEEELSLEDCANRWKNRYPVFKAVYYERGITHKKLAQLSGLSPSSLSQFLSKIRSEKVFLSRTMGREKHYYLTEKGEKIYHLLSEKQLSQVCSTYTKELNTGILNVQETIQNIEPAITNIFMAILGNGSLPSNTNVEKRKEMALADIIDARKLISNDEEEIWERDSKTWEVLSGIS